MNISTSPIQPITLNTLNHTDLNDLNTHPDLLYPGQHAYLNILELRLLHSPAILHPMISGNGTVLISTRSTYTQKFCFCGRRTPQNRSGRCNLWTLCPRCSFLRQRNYLCRYLPSFHQGHWRFATLSYTGHLEFNSASSENALHLWDSAKTAILQIIENQDVSGAFWVEEIAILDFLPLRVIPHVHAILDSELTPRRLRECFLESMRSQNPLLPPTVNVQGIPSAKSLGQRLQYLVKPINLYRRYRERWDAMRINARQLNLELSDFIHGYREITQFRHRIHVRGTLDPRSRKSFIGTTRENLPDQRVYVDAILRGDDESGLS